MPGWSQKCAVTHKMYYQAWISWHWHYQHPFLFIKIIFLILFKLFLNNPYESKRNYLWRNCAAADPGDQGSTMHSTRSFVIRVNNNSVSWSVTPSWVKNLLKMLGTSFHLNCNLWLIFLSCFGIAHIKFPSSYVPQEKKQAFHFPGRAIRIKFSIENFISNNYTMVLDAEWIEWPWTSWLYTNKVSNTCGMSWSCMLYRNISGIYILISDI